MSGIFSNLLKVVEEPQKKPPERPPARSSQQTRANLHGNSNQKPRENQQQPFARPKTQNPNAMENSHALEDRTNSGSGLKEGHGQKNKTGKKTARAVNGKRIKVGIKPESNTKVEKKNDDNLKDNLYDPAFLQFAFNDKPEPKPRAYNPLLEHPAILCINFWIRGRHFCHSPHTKTTDTTKTVIFPHGLVLTFSISPTDPTSLDLSVSLRGQAPKPKKSVLPSVQSEDDIWEQSNFFAEPPPPPDPKRDVKIEVAPEQRKRRFDLCFFDDHDWKRSFKLLELSPYVSRQGPMLKAMFPGLYPYFWQWHTSTVVQPVKEDARNRVDGLRWMMEGFFVGLAMMMENPEGVEGLGWWFWEEFEGRVEVDRVGEGVMFWLVRCWGAFCGLEGNWGAPSNEQPEAVGWGRVRWGQLEGKRNGRRVIL